MDSGYDPEAGRARENGPAEDYEPAAVRAQIVEMITDAAGDADDRASEAAADAKEALSSLARSDSRRGEKAVARAENGARRAQRSLSRIEALMEHEALKVGFDPMDDFEGPEYDESGEGWLPFDGGRDVYKARDQARHAVASAVEAATAAQNARKTASAAGRKRSRGRR